MANRLNSIKKLCDRAVWIYEGKVREDGNVKEVIDDYLKVCG